MKSSRVFTLCPLVIGVLSVALMTVPRTHAQMGMSNDGVIFPDGSVRKTAASSEAIYAIGSIGPAGGFVFHVTADGLHGLEAAPADQSNATWGCSFVNIVGANATAIGKGARNTDDILHGCETAGIAAAVADGYVSPSGYYDWYLPSKDELNKMYTVLHANGLGGFASDFYWSSSGGDVSIARDQSFFNGNQFLVSKSSTDRVRAVRAF